jgi:hypothetical protein
MPAALHNGSLFVSALVHPIGYQGMWKLVYLQGSDVLRHGLDRAGCACGSAQTTISSG